MDMRHGRIGYACVLLLSASVGWTSSSFANGVTGTYTGTYQSFQSNGDAGTVTITVDADGAVTCDFYSAAKQAHATAKGSANARPSGASVSFSIPGQPSGPLIPLTETSVNCVNGPRINPGGPADPTPSQMTYFAAQIVYDWAPSVGIFSFKAGTWISASGDGGQFSLGAPAIDASSPLNAEALTGLWYDASFTGSGLSITASTVGLIATYYGWDKNGQRLWLASDIGPSQVVLGQSIALNLSQTMNGTFASPAPPSTAMPWGTIALTFTSCTTATATLHGADGDSTQSLTLLVGLSGLGCQ